MIERTYVIKADEETGYSTKASVSNRLDEVAFFRPNKVICITHDVPESWFTQEELWNKEEVEKFISDAKKKGREEAWALARKIGGSTLTGNYTPRTLGEIFGTASIMSILENDYETVRKKISDYENMPKVGDIVTFKDSEKYGSERAVVTFVENPNNNVCCGILYDNGSPAVFPIEDLVKTGEHVDLTDIFKKLKGEE